MKKIVSVSLSVAILLIVGCAPNERYLDLSTGETVKLEKDESTGLMVNKATNEPVYMYVDTRSHDTILGSTGEVINGHVVKIGDRKYVFDGDQKLKMDEDGSLKYKDGDYKVKIEADEAKTKNGDRKVKVDDDEKKIKNN